MIKVPACLEGAWASLLGLQMDFPLCTQTAGVSSSSCKDTGLIGLEPLLYLLSSIILNYLPEGPMSNVYIQSDWRLGLQPTHFGGTKFSL